MKKAEEMLKEFEKKYSDIIKDIVKKGHICSYVPVETLGCVEFDKFSSLIQGDIDSLKEHYSLVDKKNTKIKSNNSDVLGAYILTKFIEPYKNFEPIIERILGDRLSILKKLSKKVKIISKPDEVIPLKFTIPQKVIQKVNDSGSCLHSSSKIMMVDGIEKNICDIKPGDKVLSFNRCGEIEPQLVRRLIINGKTSFIKLCFEDNYEILSTANHLFYSTNGWKSADKLEINNEVLFYDKEKRLRNKKLIEKIDNYNSDICYNIYVSKNSNYFANGALVSSMSVLKPLRDLFERIRFYLSRGNL